MLDLLINFQVLTFFFPLSSKHFYPTVNSWHLQHKYEFKLLTNSTIRLTNETQALSRQSEREKRVWSGWKKIMASSHWYRAKTADSQGDARRHASDAQSLEVHYPAYHPERVEDLGVSAVLLFLSLLSHHHFPTISPRALCVAEDEGLGSTVIIIMHLTFRNVSRFSLSGRILAI